MGLTSLLTLYITDVFPRINRTGLDANQILKRLLWKNMMTYRNYQWSRVVLFSAAEQRSSVASSACVSVSLSIMLLICFDLHADLSADLEIDFDWSWHCRRMYCRLMRDQCFVCRACRLLLTHEATIIITTTIFMVWSCHHNEVPPHTLQTPRCCWHVLCDLCYT